MCRLGYSVSHLQGAEAAVQIVQSRGEDELVIGSTQDLNRQGSEPDPSAPWPPPLPSRNLVPIQDLKDSEIYYWWQLEAESVGQSHQGPPIAGTRDLQQELIPRLYPVDNSSVGKGWSTMGRHTHTHARRTCLLEDQGQGV